MNRRIQCIIGGIIWIGVTIKVPTVTAWIPPHPKANADWESVHDMRRRLDQPFNYSTHTIAPEMCRYLSEEDCEAADENMQKHATSHKAIQKALWRQRANPNLGNIKVLVLMIRFTDHLDREMLPKPQVEEFWNTKMQDYFDVNSQGRYSIDPVIIDWETTDNTEEYYSFGMRGIVSELQQFAWPILDMLDNTPGWDWSEYDIDGNGDLDSVVFMHSGYGAETLTTDCYGAEYENRIWAHAFSRSRNSWRSKDGSVKLNGYTVSSVFDEDCGTEPAKIGLTAHEYMHTFGLEDLYDGADALAASGIGAFDIMAYPYGQRDNGDLPGHLSPWSKVLAEWLEPTIIDASGEYTLKAAEISDECYRITLADYGLVAEYLYIENRQPLEYDADIWAAGLVIYHIDDAADLQVNRGYPGQEGWPENGNHYQVAVAPKDTLYDLEQGVNSGDAGDVWLPGDILGPGKGGTIFPNTDQYSGGIIQESGLWIKVLSQTETDVTFQVGGFDGEPVPEIETVAPTSNPTGVPTGIPTVSSTAPPTSPRLEESPTRSPSRMPAITSTITPTLIATATVVPATTLPTAQNMSPSEVTALATQNPTASVSETPITQTLSPTIGPSTMNLTQSPTSSLSPTQGIVFDLTQEPTLYEAILTEEPTQENLNIPTIPTIALRPTIPTIPTIASRPSFPTIPATIPTIPPRIPTLSYLDRFGPFGDLPSDSTRKKDGFLSTGFSKLTHRIGDWMHDNHHKSKPNANRDRASNNDVRKPRVFQATPRMTASSSDQSKISSLFATMTTACLTMMAIVSL